MTGIPVVSIGPSHMKIFPYGHELFEGHELAPFWSDSPGDVRKTLVRLLREKEFAESVSAVQRTAAIAKFGREPVAQAWAEFLG